MKTNNNKICLNIFLKGLLLVPLFLLSLGFIGISSAKADNSDFQEITTSGNYITIPDVGADNVVVCGTTGDQDEPAPNMVINGVNATAIDWGYYYWENVPSGVKSFYIDGAYSSSQFVCFISGGSYLSKTIFNPRSFYINTDIGNNVLLALGSRFNDSNPVISSGTGQIFNKFISSAWGDTVTRYTFGKKQDAQPMDFTITGLSQWVWDTSMFMVFTPAAPEGLSIQENVYNPVTGNVFLSGTCEQKGSGIYQMNLYAYEIGTSTPDYMKQSYPDRDSLVSCIDGEWTGLFNGAGLTGSNRLVIDDSFYGTEIASVDINWQTVTGSILFNYGNLSTININSNVSGGATTTLNFVYNICDDPDYSATSSKIWLVQQDGANYQNEYWEEEYTYQTPTCSGTGQISFYVAQGAEDYFRAYFAYANSYDVPILKSGYFYISVVNNQTLATTTVAQLLGDTARNLACTEEEWNTVNDGFLGFNYTRTICAAKAATFDTFNIISNAITKLISVTINKVLANVFPLTIPINVVQSWNESQVTALPESLSWLNATDEDGDISVGFPKEWTGGDTDTNFKLFGSHMLTENPKADLFFSRIRNFLIYVFYALWLLKMKEAAEDFYDEWMAEATRIKHDKNNYQL